jgi:hypothetical protein
VRCYRVDTNSKNNAASHKRHRQQWQVKSKKRKHAQQQEKPRSNAVNEINLDEAMAIVALCAMSELFNPHLSATTLGTGSPLFPHGKSPHMYGTK